MVDVSTEVESKTLLQPGYRIERVFLACFLELLQCSVQALDIGSVMLGVMQFHDLAGDVGCQCAVVVGKIRQFVGSHCSPLGSFGSGVKLTLMLRPPIVELVARCHHLTSR